MIRGSSTFRRKRARKRILSIILIAIVLTLFVLVKRSIISFSAAIFIPLGVIVFAAVALDLFVNGITKRHIITALVVIFAVFLYFAVKFSWFSLTVAIAIGIAISITVFVIGLVIYDIITKNVTDFINTHKKGSLTALTALLVAAVFCVCYYITPICTFLGIKNIEVFTNVFKNSDLFDYYTAQLSITFISISVLSVLSDKSVNIYWANVSEDRLIKPTFSCFAAYTYYSIGATLGAGLGVILNNGLIFAAFFLANILVMIVLTASMVDVYYGRDIKIKKLRKELANDYYNGRRPNTKTDRDEYIPVSSTKYREKILGIRQHLYNSYENNELTELKEIYELYACCPDCFYSKEGETAVKTIVETIDEKTLSLFISAVLQELNYYFCKTEAEEIRNRNRFVYYFGNKKKEKETNWEYTYVWDIDKPLWKALSDDGFVGFLKEATAHRNPMTERILKDLILCIKKRMAFIYNYEVLKRDMANKEVVTSKGKTYMFNYGTAKKGSANEEFRISDYLVDTKEPQRISLRRKGNNYASIPVGVDIIKEILSKYENYQEKDASEIGIFGYLSSITKEILSMDPKFEEELDDFPFHKALM